jgi:ubiquitin C-terminal hydrolase
MNSVMRCILGIVKLVQVYWDDDQYNNLKVKDDELLG